MFVLKIHFGKSISWCNGCITIDAEAFQLNLIVANMLRILYLQAQKNRSGGP
jgi:hypothetical protein